MNKDESTQKEEPKKKFEFPLLLPADISVRVNRLTQCYEDTNTGEKVVYYKADLLLYKNARCDMYYLDKIVGCMNWQRRHRVDGEDMICTIAILDKANGIWTEKDDVGEYSNLSAKKGRASDAFKRAAVNWGIGRELYTAPKINIKLLKHESYKNNKNNQVLSNDVNFVVSEIEYDKDRRIITALVLKDNLGNYRFAWPESKKQEVYIRIEQARRVAALVDASIKQKPVEFTPIVPPPVKAAEAPPAPNTGVNDDTRLMCEVCGVGITATVASISKRLTGGNTVCRNCREKILKERNKQNYAKN